MGKDDTFKVFSSRKSKRKKKQRSRANIKVTTDHNLDTSDTVVETIEHELEATNSDQTSEFDHQNTNYYVAEDDYYKHNNKVYTDSLLGGLPEVQNAEEISESAKQLEDQQLNLQKGHEYLEENSQEEPTSEAKYTYNVRALSKHAETYELEKFEKNMLLIFNQDKVNGYSKPRYGTEKDVEALEKTFKRFSFEVKEHKDFTKKKIFDTLDEFFKQDFTEYGCVGIAVLTHGSNMGLLWAKDQQYSEIEIINYFKVHDKPSLVTKPKFLIIQACRGRDIIPGVTVLTSSKIHTDMDSSEEPYILPAEADLLILHSCYYGNPSHRDELFGSWFILSLCKKINQLAATHDMESIMTEVKRDVALDNEHEVYNRRTLKMQKNKQMPVMTTTLIRKLYLKKFGDPPLPPVINVSDGPTSRRESIDVVDFAAPSIPMLVQFGPCSCFLGHFDYIKNCLRFFVEDNSEDDVAKSYLEVAETLEDEVKFNATKEKLAKAICKHLTVKAKDCSYYRFLYFYKHF